MIRQIQTRLSRLMIVDVKSCLITNIINIESKGIASLSCLIYLVLALWQRSHITSDTQRDHSRKVLFCGSRLLTLDFRLVKTFLKDRFLQLGAFETRVKFLIFIGCESEWRIAHRSQISVPVDISPDRTSSLVFLCQESEHFLSLVLIKHTQRAISLVYVRAPVT